MAAKTGTTGWDLLATLQQQAEYVGYYKTQPPVACPNDGTPLKDGPPGHAAVLFCPFDGWQYPRDWDAESMSGM